MVIALMAAALVAAAPPAATGPPPEAPDPSIADGTAQAALDAARGRWAAARLEDYRFRVGITCFCPPDFSRAVTVVVRDGRPRRPPQRLRRVATVPRLFARVQEAIDAEVAELDVTYGRSLGVPRRVFIDRSRMIADEEVGYRASSPRPLAG